MKRFITLLLAVLIVLPLVSCAGGTGTRTVKFQGITMKIPSMWKPEKRTLADNYAVYEKPNVLGHEYKLMLMDVFSLLGTFGGDLERAGAFFKEVTEDDASYVDVSDPVAGRFADRYDMHTIECTYHVLNPLKGGEAEYPCKLIRIYMDGHDVEIRFTSEEGDFEVFDEIIAAAVCD